jgi:4-hydroxybenzoyl-CoA thioesterase
MPFRTQVPVRFGDVDHAGIVYYPRFFIYFHEAFEDFFNENGFPYHVQLNERRLGFPTVHIETDFKLPLRYGDALDIELTVPHIGEHSAKIRYVGYRHRDGQRACQAEITCACVNLDSFRSERLPDDLRAFFGRFAS